MAIGRLLIGLSVCCAPASGVHDRDALLQRLPSAPSAANASDAGRAAAVAQAGRGPPLGGRNATMAGRSDDPEATNTSEDIQRAARERGSAAALLRDSGGPLAAVPPEGSELLLLQGLHTPAWQI
eukprot:CAMPEP_0168496384 /NCGR_PEP_ID=MMETSP0228-20121227/72233_1 /TAXON_ID=133427 /ORGANISM="Protoceratium reticulatum, Strain CCCM 535 (=CCMP 1889)" /LENGTH=124 /DNA_ID=CAMNT_0008513249 /DNA_START=26 /DNA_END=397 /DNA_ORIENTATION=+